jgi:hypothetical protein
MFGLKATTFSPKAAMLFTLGSGVGFGIILGSGVAVVAPAAASAAKAVVDVVTACSSSSPCIGGKNAGSGPGVVATSNSGRAVNAAGWKYGIYATAGEYGTGAYGSSDAVGVEGNSPGDPEVQGSGTGVFANARQGIGLFANAPASTAVLAEGYSGVQGYAFGGGTGVYGESDSSTAASFNNTSGNTSTVLNVAAGVVAGSGTFLADLQSSDGNGYVIVDDSGDEFISGYIFTDGSCENGCITKRVRTYAPRESEPTMEDVGRARLAAGSAYVPLDPAFANVLDRQADYSVLITPEGETNGLYIASRTSKGFSVREIHRGTSTAMFSYRIVAKPYGKTASRLPFVAAPKPIKPLAAAFHPAPLPITR